MRLETFFKRGETIRLGLEMPDSLAVATVTAVLKPAREDRTPPPASVPGLPLVVTPYSGGYHISLDPASSASLAIGQHFIGATVTLQNGDVIKPDPVLLWIEEAV